jgi:hypothetical protein
MNSNLKENQELRAAMRKVFWPPSRLEEAEVAKRVNKTPEEFINADIDTFIDGGWGAVFQIFHANHGRYPERAKTAQAAEEYRQLAKSEGINIDRSIDLGSLNPNLYGRPPRGSSNPKLEFYLGELEAELNVLLPAVEKAGNGVIFEHLKRIMFIFHRVKDSRKEGEGKS